MGVGEYVLKLKVNKFEQVSSDDHQMSLAGGEAFQVPCAEGGVQGGGDGRGIPGPMSGGCTIPCGLFHNACDFTYPPVNRHTTVKTLPSSYYFCGR